MDAPELHAAPSYFPLPRNSRALTLAILLLSCFLTFLHPAEAAASAARPIVAYLTAGPLTDEDQAAVRWLASVPGYRAVTVEFPAASEGEEQAKDRAAGAGIVWVHLPDEAALERWRRCAPAADALKAAVGRGASVLLTDCAAMLAADLQLDPRAPELRTLDIKDDWLFDQKGLQGFRGHPVFDGLFGGAFLWDGDHDQKLPTIGFFGDAWPANGRVIGIEKSYVNLHSDRHLLVEYPASAGGHVLAVGGFVYFQGPNPLRLNLERFLANCLGYLAGKPSGGRITFWEPSDGRPKPFSVQSPPLTSAPASVWKDLPESGPCIRRESTNEFFDLAGRRTLVMGKEKGGIQEFWVHPFRVFRDYRAGLILGEAVRWLDEFWVSLEIRPESLMRTYHTPSGDLREILFPSLDRPGMLIRYEASLREPARLVISCGSDLRWMWPYDEKAPGEIHYAWDDGLAAFRVRDGSGDFCGLLGADRRPDENLVGAYADLGWSGGKLTGTPANQNRVGLAAVYPLEPDKNPFLTVCLAGTDQGAAEAEVAHRRLLGDPRLAYDILTKHYRDLFENRVMIEGPDPEFNRLWPWALVGADRFVTETPGLGTALTAGFSTSDRGWDGGQAVSGRPGYGWYFGRDAAWSGLALDLCGDFATVRAELEFLQKYQDFRGKIFHELTTSGVVHYDAADATPLYVILAADYLRASGDAAFIRRSWPHIKKAMDFLYSTDTDGDGLIENTGVGHGWVEGGKLFGAHTEHYLAACWTQALAGAAELATAVGQSEPAARYRRDSAKVRGILDRDFWNPSTNFCNYGKFRDGTYNPEPTVLPAVAMAFGLLDPARAQPVLDAYAGNGFSTDWGVRILSSASPLFNPEGYHYGSVWPLFTGWTALAEYRNGRSAQGFSHMMNNMLIKKHWAAGFVEEVMNGAVYKPSGVCPHQCWSETNVLHPALAGMVGWAPDAPHQSATLTPRFPLDWDTVQVKNLRVGASVLDLAFTRSTSRTVYRLTLREGPPVKVHVRPERPLGMEIRKYQLDGRLIQAPTGDLSIQSVPVDLGSQRVRELVLEHTGGAGVVPFVPWPLPDEASEDFRIIRETLTGSVFEVTLEGRSGHGGAFQVMIFDQSVKVAQGVDNERSEPHGRVTLWVDFPATAEPYWRGVVRLMLEKVVQSPQ